MKCTKNQIERKARKKTFEVVKEKRKGNNSATAFALIQL